MNGTTLVSPAVDRMLWPAGFSAIRDLVERHGGQVEFADLQAAYAESIPPEDPRRLRFTGLTDGLRISLHSGRQERTAPALNAWDSLHLLGHMFQWNMSAGQAGIRGLRFWGARARDMSTQDFAGASEAKLAEMQTYEIEANGLALAVFDAVTHHLYTVEQGRAYARQMRWFMANDLAFLTRYYGAPKTHPFCSPTLLMPRLRAIPPPPPDELRFVAQPRAGAPVVHRQN